jgi:predicted NBD/HSP70 family sugar kinase
MRRINVQNFRTATNVTAREVNRRIILNVVRIRQPISRAEVARHTGLQRSTVSLIVDQLIKEGWIVEGAIGHSTRGRRPIFLQLNNDQLRIIGITVRPLATRIALADVNGHFVSQESFATPEDPKKFLKLLCQRVKDFISREPNLPYEGIGISLPGRVDRETHRLTFAPNLAWHDVDVKTPLEKATGLPVELENAANACALAELYFERHSEGEDNLIAVAVAEGIGTGIVVNGQLLRGPSGLAGEFGHMTIEPEGLLCRCGNRGCWEMYASNQAAIRYYTEALAENRNGQRRASPPDNRKITFPELLRLAEGGDIRATGALDRMANYLGVGIANLVTGLTPALIVLVGEVTLGWPRIGPIVEKVVSQRTISPLKTRIVPRDDALQPRLRGTVALVLQKHLGAPVIG